MTETNAGNSSTPTGPMSAEAAKITAEAQLLRARAELFKAERDFAAASKPPDQTVAADTSEKARVDARKNLLDSQKAALDAKKAADTAAAQAAIGPVTGTSIEGKTDLKTDAGKTEATLLASRALTRGAEQIAGAVKDVVKGKRVFLLPGGEPEQFANYRQFLLQQELTQWKLAAARTEAERLAADADNLVSPSSAFSASAGPPSVPMLTAAGVALDAVSKLGSYFMSNYEIGGVALTTDPALLFHAVANSLIAAGATVVAPSRRIPEPGHFSTIIEPVAKGIAEADARAATLNATAQKTRQASEAETDFQRKDQLKTAFGLYEQAVALLRKAMTAAEEFIATLGVKDQTGVALLTRITQEKAVCDEMNRDGTLVMTVNVHSFLGGYYTKKNLWTFFGGIPFYAAGGAVVGFSLFDKHGVVTMSGVFPVHAGYTAVDAVRQLIASKSEDSP